MSADHPISNNNEEQGVTIIDATASTDIGLTPRQQRVLHYLARRRMRNAHITRRPIHANTLAEASRGEEKVSILPGDLGERADKSGLEIHDTTSPLRVACGSCNEAVGAINRPLHFTGEVKTNGTVPLTPDDPFVEASVSTPFPESGHEPEEDEQSLVEVPFVSMQALHTTSVPEAIIVPEELKWAFEGTPFVDTQPGVQSLPTTPIPAPFEEALLPSEADGRRNSEDYLSSRQDAPETPPGAALLDPTSKKLIRVNAGILGSLSPLNTGPSQAQKIWKRRKILRHLSRKHLRKTRAGEYRARRRLWLTIASTVLAILVIFLSLGTAGSIAAYQFSNRAQTQYGHQLLTLRDLLPLDNLKMYDSKGVLLMQMADQGLHTTVTLDQVAPVLVNATVATEDKNFWTNPGIDVIGIIRAALDNLRSGHVIEGGSTITQQLIKNLVVGDQATLERKLEEIVLAPQINSHYSKRDIMEMYLNSIYYGHQAYGIDAAATVYFGLQDKPGGKRAAMQLDLAQAAMLAGIPSNPSAYDPLEHPKIAFDRFENVLALMETQGYLKKIDALDAIKEAQSSTFFKTAPGLANRAPHFTNFVLSQLVQLFHLKDESQLSRSGMLVHTTLDINLQDKIQKIAQRHIAELRAAHNLTNAAEVLIDFHTGAIISLLGSIDYNDKSIDGQFDVATQGYRQPGSSFKPYVYVTAFKQGASPAQAISDEPTTIDNSGGNPPEYSPTNYDLHYHGHMTLRCALQNSLNVPAVRVLKQVGINAAMQTAYDMGITSYTGTPGYSLVLGGLSIRLIDHTSAMGTFADGGVHIPYYAIEKVISGNTQQVLYQHQLDPGKRVISPQLAYMMSSVLSDNESRIPEFYDCNVLQLYSNSQNACYNGSRGAVRPAAAKTGTTQNFRDNWTVGYTTDYVMGVWAGNDDNSPMYQVTGVMGAAPIWHDSMLVAEQGRPIRDFTNPGGLVQATVTYPDGVKTTDWFLPGTVPNFGQATATPGSPTSTPGTGGAPAPAPSAVPPYCPGSYSFAFNPPPAGTPTNGWW